MNNNQQSHFLNQEFSCRIPHHKVENQKVYYVILFISHTYQLVKVQQMRYSDLEKLHDKLDKSKSLLNLPINLPPFPGKKIIGSHNASLQGIKLRKTQLQEYFNQLLSEEKTCALPSLKQLLPDTCQEESNDLKSLLSFNKQEQQYSFQIKTYQQLGDKVLYNVHILDNHNKMKWKIQIRYSDLRDIHQALKESFKRRQLPEFPKRKIFGITNDDPEQIEERRKGLENYLNQLFQDFEVIKSEIIQYFLSNSKNEYKKQLRFEEQKQLIKLKLSGNQKNSDKKQNNEQKSEPQRQLKKANLFTIKEQQNKYEDDNTTLLRYPPHSLYTSNPVFGQRLSKNTYQPISRADSVPLYQDDDLIQDLLCLEKLQLRRGLKN